MSDPATLALLTELLAKIDRLDGKVQELADGRGDYLNADQAGMYLGAANRDRIYDLTAEGKIRAYRDGRRLLYRRADLDAYVTGQVAE